MGEMDKRYEQIEHLSDVGLRAYGKSLEELFENAGEGMFSIMCDLAKVSPLSRREIDIVERENVSVEQLLIAWLENLLYLFEVEKMLFSSFKVHSVKVQSDKSNKDGREGDEKSKEARVKAEIFGEKIDFTKHEIIVAIKAPTYHTLEVKRDSLSGSWVANVIFDI